MISQSVTIEKDGTYTIANYGTIYLYEGDEVFIDPDGTLLINDQPAP